MPLLNPKKPPLPKHIPPVHSTQDARRKGRSLPAQHPRRTGTALAYMFHTSTSSTHLSTVDKLKGPSNVLTSITVICDETRCRAQSGKSRVRVGLLSYVER